MNNTNHKYSSCVNINLKFRFPPHVKQVNKINLVARLFFNRTPTPVEV